MTGEGRFYGKYRGVVASNIDPLGKGRLLVQVADVLADDPCLWAMPALPATGSQMGTYTVPPVNGGVWVEFEQGNPDHPVWTGCWAASTSELPPPAASATPSVATIVLQTVGKHHLVVSDLPGDSGGVLLKSSSGASVAVNERGITLDNGKGASITLSSSTVTINQGALVIE
jgi:uncharacterized protein involved in type VI secretion and phage assembly